MRRRCLRLAALALGLLVGRAVRAGHCDPSDSAAVTGAPHASSVDEKPSADRQLAYAAAVRFEAASYANARYEGSWIGGRPELALRWRAMRARAWAPFYQLERNGLGSSGPGDLGFELGWQISPASWPGAASLTPLFALTLPTGSAREQLGMGHAMVMPGLQVAAGAGRLDGRVLASYAGSQGGGHDHAATGPLVDPMSSSEVVLGGAFGWRLAERVRLDTMALYAEPTGRGQRRGLGGAGLSFSPGPFSITVAAQAPFVGDPFRWRFLASVALRG